MNNYAKEWTTWAHKCSSCQKTRRVNIVYTVHFNVGTEYEDSISEAVCLPCEVKRKVKEMAFGIKYRFPKVETFKVSKTGAYILIKSGSNLRFINFKWTKPRITTHRFRIGGRLS